MMLIIILMVLSWVALPFVPSLLELRQRQDAGPLALSDRYKEDLRLGETEEPGEVDVPPGRTLGGTVSAGHTLRLGADCSFERLHAPIVCFGEEVEQEVPSPQPCLAFEPPSGTEKAANRFLVRGNLVVPARTLIEGDLVVTGDLHLGADTVLEGSAKSHGHLTVASNVVAHGSLLSRGDLCVGVGSQVDGVVAADGDLLLAAGSVVGAPGAETTAAGRHVRAAMGARVHGTVWALEGGRVTAD